MDAYDRIKQHLEIWNLIYGHTPKQEWDREEGQTVVAQTIESLRLSERAARGLSRDLYGHAAYVAEKHQYLLADEGSVIATFRAVYGDPVGVVYHYGDGEVSGSVCLEMDDDIVLKEDSERDTYLVADGTMHPMSSNFITALFVAANDYLW